MSNWKILAALILMAFFGSCSTTEADRRVGEIDDRAYKDLYCEKEDVVVAMISPRVIGARGCGRTRYYSIFHPTN